MHKDSQGAVVLAVRDECAIQGSRGNLTNTFVRNLKDGLAESWLRPEGIGTASGVWHFFILYYLTGSSQGPLCAKNFVRSEDLRVRRPSTTHQLSSAAGVQRSRGSYGITGGLGLLRQIRVQS